MPLSLETLAANAEAVEKLSFTSDFELETDAGEPLYFSVDGVADVARLGRDGAGGDFVQLLPSQRVLYVSSEGQAGVVAADIGEFVALLVACPYWRDILKYSANGDLHQMRRAAAALAATYEDDEDLDEALAVEASRRHISRAALIRELVRQQLRPPGERDPFTSLIGDIDDDAGDIDEVVYGQ